jgi:hypothetical protein
VDCFNGSSTEDLHIIGKVRWLGSLGNADDSATGEFIASGQLVQHFVDFVELLHPRFALHASVHQEIQRFLKNR